MALQFQIGIWHANREEPHEATRLHYFRNEVSVLMMVITLTNIS
jgi:hypothetical protein